MSTLDDRLRAFGRRRYDAPRAGSFVLLSACFVVLGGVFTLLPPHRAGLGQLIAGATGLAVVELVGLHRRRRRRRRRP